jgi:hypothetical protein
MQHDHARFAWWLAAAVLLHALALLIPARQHFSPTAAVHSLTIALSGGRRAPPQPPAAEISPADRAVNPAPESVQVPARARPTPAKAPAPERPSPAATVGAQAREPGSPVTAARLLDDALRREWNVPETVDPRRLGVFEPTPSEPWAATPATSAGHGGAGQPAGNGVIDQWLCGRAEAWDPMSPLIEPVIMYRACGDGRRSFEMPPRVLLR